MRLEVCVIRAVRHLAQIKGDRADTFDVGRTARDAGHHVQGFLGFRRHVRHAEAHHGTVQRRRGGGNDLLTLVSERSTADSDGTLATDRKIRQTKRRGMHHRKNRLGRTLLVEFEQGDRNRPFGHATGEVDHTVDAADAPVPFSGMAFARTGMPESVERVHVRKTIADELHQTLVQFRSEMQMVFRQFKTFHITRIRLIRQRVLARILQDTSHFEGRLPQFHGFSLSSSWPASVRPLP